MNWTTLLRFRKQVEDLAREGVVLAEWEKSQEASKREELHHEMEMVVTGLEDQIQAGVDSLLLKNGIVGWINSDRPWNSKLTKFNGWKKPWWGYARN